MGIFTTRTPKASTSTPDLINGIPNPSFETNGDYWVDTGWGYGPAGTGSFVGRAADQYAFAGGFTMQKRWNTAAGSNAGAGVYTQVPSIPGNKYTASAFMSANYTDQAGQIVFQFLDGSGNQVGSFDGATSNLNAAWTRVSATATAPTGTTVMRIIVRLGGASPGRKDTILRIDGAQLTDGTQLQGYFDGDTARAQDGRSYAWGGTPHASNSLSYPPDAAANYITPTLYQLPSHGSVGMSAAYDLLDGGLGLVLRGGAAPDGLLRFYFAGGGDPVQARADAYNCLEQHRQPVTWILQDDDNPKARMQYMVQPGGRVQLVPGSGIRTWWCEVPYRKLSDA